MKPSLTPTQLALHIIYKAAGFYNAANAVSEICYQNMRRGTTPEALLEMLNKTPANEWQVVYTPPAVIHPVKRLLKPNRR